MTTRKKTMWSSLNKELKELAISTWERRQDRDEHPDGYWDKAGRWYPSEDEEQECCSRIRGPSRAYPYSLMKHCRSREHVAYLVMQHDRLVYQVQVEMDDNWVLDKKIGKLYDAKYHIETKQKEHPYLKFRIYRESDKYEKEFPPLALVPRKRLPKL